MADMKKLLHTFDEADELLNGKIERTNLSTIVASATASVENKKTVLIRGTGRNIESLKVGGRTVQDGTPTPDAPVEVKGVGDYDEETGKYKIPVSCNGETTNIYLDTPLFDGEVADLVSGKAEKKYDILKLTGNEDWMVWTGANTVQFYVLKSMLTTKIYSNIAKSSTVGERETNTISVYISTAKDAIAFNMYGYKSNMTLDEWKTYLQTHDVYVVYEIASTTETFDGTDIPTTAAEQEVNINTELVPSSIEAVTFGDYYTKSEVDKITPKISKIYSGNVSIDTANASVRVDIPTINTDGNVVICYASVKTQSTTNNYTYSATFDITNGIMRFNASVAQIYLVEVYAIVRPL